MLDSKAVSYIHLEKDGKTIFGVGMDNNISLASIKGIICAVNRFEEISKFISKYLNSAL